MSANKPSERTEHVDLTKLNIQQLQQLKMEFESDLGLFQDSLQTLMKVKTKYASSKEALEQIKLDWDDKQILVPLTGSMYVPGVLKEVNNFVIDIGTGYYAEKNLDGAKDYFKRRIDYVQEQIENIDKLQIQKSRFLSAVHDLIELKLSALQSKPQPA